MTAASEALYFDNAPVAHIVAREERERLAGIMQRDRALIARLPRLSPIVTRIRQPDRAIAAIHAKRGLLSAADWAVLEAAEREEGA